MDLFGVALGSRGDGWELFVHRPVVRAMRCKSVIWFKRPYRIAHIFKTQPSWLRIRSGHCHENGSEKRTQDRDQKNRLFRLARRKPRDGRGDSESTVATAEIAGDHHVLLQRIDALRRWPGNRHVRRRKLRELGLCHRVQDAGVFLLPTSDRILGLR